MNRTPPEFRTEQWTQWFRFPPGSDWTSCSPPLGRLQAAVAFSASLSSGRKGAGGGLGGLGPPAYFPVYATFSQRGSWNVAAEEEGRACEATPPHTATVSG